MSDNFDIVNLYKHYSKNILKESNTTLVEKEEDEVLQPEKFKRFKVTLYYDDDPSLVPASFQIDYIYAIAFNAKAISEDFSDEQIDFDKEVNIGDDEIEKMVMNKLNVLPDQPKKGSGNKKVDVNVDQFYRDFFKKNLPSYVITNKLNDLIRAGVIPIENWKIYAVTYSTQVDDKLLSRKVDDGLRKGKAWIASPFGYQIALESANKNQRYSSEQVKEFAIEFSKALDTSLFKDTKYYKIVKK